MPIKRNTITKPDFEEALSHLGLSVQACAKETGIPRGYLSDLKNRDVPLRKDDDVKLREFFADQGVEFEKASAQRSPAKRDVREVRYVWPVAETVDDEALAGVQRIIEENDARMAVLLKQQAQRSDGVFFGDGSLAKEAQQALQEAGVLMAENYVLLRMVRGWPALGVKAAGDGAETIRDVLFATFRARLEEAGLVEPMDEEPADKGEEEEAA